MLALTQFGVDIAYSAIGHHYCGALVDGSTDIDIAGYKINVPDGTSCSVYWLLIACDMAIAAVLFLRFRAHYNAQGGGDATAYQQHADPGPPASTPAPAQQATPDYQVTAAW